MIARQDWIDLIPHRGRMALIDRVVGFDAKGIRAESDNHRSPAHPLRHADRLSAVHLCEYGAQAMAVHGALLARSTGQRAQPGVLIALRTVDLRVARIDDLPGPLDILAERVHSDEATWLYRFRIVHDEKSLAEGQAMVKLDVAENALK
jgi:predicted hotdog family 3-hydroxylacyl-ACP dehydratase